MAELVAFASLLEAGTPVRLTGQDSQRGTFNQRHAVMVDTETKSATPRSRHLSDKQGKFEVYNSLLSRSSGTRLRIRLLPRLPRGPRSLGRPQFGDFANGAQIIMDQFIAASEAKWGLLSRPRPAPSRTATKARAPSTPAPASSATLQLAANDNIQICQPSNAAQYFHLLRRQAMRFWRKPLVVFTPKSMLRHPDASSTLADFAIEKFQNVLPDNDVKAPRRLLVCSGKIGHNLRVEREKRKDFSVGIIFLEQMYPWPEAELQAALNHHPEAQEIIWVQEEPANMGAFTYVMPLLRRLARRSCRPQRQTQRKRNPPQQAQRKPTRSKRRPLIDLALGSPE